MSCSPWLKELRLNLVKMAVMVTLLMLAAWPLLALRPKGSRN